MKFYRFKELGFRLPIGSGLIKAPHASKISCAADLVDSAHKYRKQMVDEAKQHFENERQRGFWEGQQAADEAALERIFSEQAALESGLAKIEEGLTELVLATVKKIIFDFDDISLAEALVRNGLRKVRGEQRVHIHVPEALTEAFNARLDTLLAEFTQIELIEIVEDSKLAAPNIVIETAVGRIECDINEKLDRLSIVIGQFARERSSRFNNIMFTDND